MPPTTADLGALLDALLDADVAFVIVGGAAAVLHGAPVTTQDLDIVPEQSDANIERLDGVLQAHDARVRDLAGRIIRPRREDLMGTGQLNLITDLGPLDILCRLHDGRGYEDLVARAVRLVDETRVITVVDLPTLIAIKSSTGRARDRLVVPLLLALLREQER